MNPRRETSKKWTHLPTELQDQIRGLFSENFKEKVGSESEFFVEGRLYPEEILLRVGFLETGRLKQCNFEVSLDLDPQKEAALEKIHLSVDAAASMMLEYLETQGDADLPYSWTSYNFEGTPLYLQFSSINTDLEAQANAILGEYASSHELFHEEGLDMVEIPPAKNEFLN